MTRRRTAALPFTRFVREVLRVQLTPGQRVLCLVAFDGIDPCKLEGSDRELARQIFGDVDTIPPEARHVLAAMCGARGGKSYVFGGLRLLHLALTVSLDTLAPGEVAAGVIVAPDLRLARQTLRYAIGAARGTPSIASLIEGETADSLTLRRPDGHSVELACLPATRGGSALRGRTLVGAVLDESAFFRDSEFVVNDSELFKAVAPRIVPGGQVIVASTPWAESGLLYELHSRNHGHAVDAIAAHAPTLLLRDDAHTRALVAREYERDAENAAREFGAVPMGAGTSDFFDPVYIAAALERGVGLPLVAVARPGAVLGLDTAFRRDASAGVIAHRHGDELVIAEVIEIAVPKGGQLVPSEVLKQIMTRARVQLCTHVICDGHYIETVREHARGMQLIEAPAGQQGKVDAHVAARRGLAEGHITIPAAHTRLAAQLRQVVSKPTPGGGLSISSPRRAGAHGDLASAFVLAAWHLSRPFHHGAPRLYVPLRTDRMAPPLPRRGTLFDDQPSRRETNYDQDSQHYRNRRH